ncbi:fructosamine kinase [Xylaria arbuscula]|nr:fructosamine kinase [Xylaria arbuscula]
MPIRTTQRDPLDPALCELLKISPECGYEELHGNKGFSRPSKVTAVVNGKAIHYFVKSGPNKDMFASEHEALRELGETVSNLTPYSLGFGKYTNNDSRYFLLMEWLEMLGSNATTAEDSHALSLPQKLAKLHSTPARTPPGYRDPQFGWHRSTYCGMTKQNNDFRASWDKFYRENRLLTILRQIEERHGSNEELGAAMEPITGIVVPRLLRNGHLGGRRGIQPVLIHGDLWHGNKAYGANPAWENPEWVLFDPSSCYCHSEYEIGIMRRFGGFSATFYHEYHQLLPKTEPKHEYEDRIALYQLYHYLNHYLMFRGGAYMDSAMDIIKKLTDKYVTSED